MSQFATTFGRRLVAALILLTLAWAPGQAAAATPAWQGVWHGTVANLPVTVCLQHNDGGDFGAYYYQKYRRIISLGPLANTPKGAAAPVWTETPLASHPDKGALWHFTGVTPSHLAGTWTDGHKKFAIALDRIAAPDAAHNGVCGSGAFNRPRYTKPAITTHKAELDGVAYERITARAGPQFGDSKKPEVETFRLLGSGAAVAAVNNALAADLPTGPDNDANFRCSAAELGANGYDGESHSSTTPVIITRRWMVSRKATFAVCGAAYPNTGASYTTWNLATGTTVDLAGWFSKAGNETTSHAPAFLALIQKTYAAGKHADPRCAEAVKNADGWTAHLAREGIAFYPSLPHAIEVCADNAVIPFATLKPYLNATGARGVASFRADLLARK